MPEPSASELRVAVMLGAATVLYLAYHLASAPQAVARIFATSDDERVRTLVSWTRRAVGVATFGIFPAIPAAIFLPGGLAACGFNLNDAPTSLWMGGVFVALTLPMVALQARKPSFRAFYPEVRVPLVGRTAAWNAVAWVAYLIAYELFFRGFLVLGLAPLVGWLPAMAISLMGYVWVHLGKHPGEAIGTLFSGSYFGFVALHTGSILGPILAHIAVALASDHLAARAARKARA